MVSHGDHETKKARILDLTAHSLGTARSDCGYEFLITLGHMEPMLAFATSSATRWTLASEYSDKPRKRFTYFATRIIQVRHAADFSQTSGPLGPLRFKCRLDNQSSILSVRRDCAFVC